VKNTAREKKASGNLKTAAKIEVIQLKATLQRMTVFLLRVLLTSVNLIERFH